MLSTDSNIQSHTGVLPVAKRVRFNQTTRTVSSSSDWGSDLDILFHITYSICINIYIILEWEDHHYVCSTRSDVNLFQTTHIID